jgi:hypothetical protein
MMGAPVTMHEDQPLMTIEDCRAAGKLLEVGCEICGRHGYFTHEEVNLPAHLSFEAASWRLSCRNCSARNRTDPRWPLWIRPDARVKANSEGGYPAMVNRPGRDWDQQERYLKLPMNAWLADVRSE